MPGKGKHRRPKFRSFANPFARRFAAAGAGGAALVMPLIGATGAQAAEHTAPTMEPAAASAETTSSMAVTKRRGDAGDTLPVDGAPISTPDHRAARHRGAADQ